MKKLSSGLAFFLFCGFSANAQHQKTGAWYIYFGNIKPKDSKFSLDMETQYRNHNLGGDLQQLLLRSGVKYQLAENANALVGYAFIQSEAEDLPDNPVRENRIYQELTLSQNTWRFFLRHRFRYEQRFVEGRDFNTRYRYNLFVDIPVNKPTLSKNAAYIALYNEIFIHGKKTGDYPGVFDRDRIYLGAGYKFTDNFAVQLGWMNQMLENSAKAQVVVSLHHKLSI
jgi:hypothetical protein